MMYKKQYNTGMYACQCVFLSTRGLEPNMKFGFFQYHRAVYFTSPQSSYNNVFLYVGLLTLGTLIESQNISTFNKSIYRPLSYPFRFVRGMEPKYPHSFIFWQTYGQWFIRQLQNKKYIQLPTPGIHIFYMII